MKNKPIACFLFSLILLSKVSSQGQFNGLDASLSNIYRLSDAKSRTLSSNITATDLGALLICFKNILLNLICIPAFFVMQPFYRVLGIVKARRNIAIVKIGFCLR